MNVRKLFNEPYNARESAHRTIYSRHYWHLSPAKAKKLDRIFKIIESKKTEALND